MDQQLTESDVTAILTAIAALCALLTAVVLLFVRKIVKALKLPASVGAALEQFARMGAAYAEEKARAYALGKLKEGPATGEQKLEVAVSAARSFAPGSLAEYSDTQVAMAVESQLGSIRPPPPELVSVRPPPSPMPPAPRLPYFAPSAPEPTTAPGTPTAKRRP